MPGAQLQMIHSAAGAFFIGNGVTELGMHAIAHQGAEVIPASATYLTNSRAHRNGHFAEGCIGNGLRDSTKPEGTEFLLEYSGIRGEAVFQLGLASQLFTQRIQDTEPAVTALCTQSISMNGGIMQA
ncbi:hypothetical protein [Pseudomonas sp. 273]|uniref:hypothetical protein n=1 Tax=Pseudomonas sp. 273 TaxID=75692 RepID=UPI0023D8B8D9|nr:hypothetical protein [Pseudomonas sp. 273]